MTIDHPLRRFLARVCAPETMARVVLRAMAKETERRYQTADEMYEALAAIG